MITEDNLIILSLYVDICVKFSSFRDTDPHASIYQYIAIIVLFIFEGEIIAESISDPEILSNIHKYIFAEPWST